MRFVALAAVAALALAQPALAGKLKRPRIDTAAAEASAAAAVELDRIAKLDDDPTGPLLNAVIVVNPDAPLQAGQLAATGHLKGDFLRGGLCLCEQPLCEHVPSVHVLLPVSRHRVCVQAVSFGLDEF